MDATDVGILLGILGVVTGIALWWRRQSRNVAIAGGWPLAQAVIESGSMELPADGRVMLPTFAFSYQVRGHYFSGRFSLVPSHMDVQGLITKLKGHKLQVHYNPERPQEWFLPDEQIEGCQVEQKLGPHVMGLYPRE